MALCITALGGSLAQAAPGDIGGGGGAGIGGMPGGGFGGGMGMGGMGMGGGLGMGGGIPLGNNAAPGDLANWGVSAGATHSDNLGRTLDDRLSGTIAQVGLQLGLTDIRPRLDTALATNLAYWDFLNGSYKSRVVGGANGGLSLNLIPERFIWTATDNFGQVAADPTAPVTPGNTQNVNVFSTGPYIELPLWGRINSLALQGLYTKGNFGTSQEDSQQYLGSVGFLHRLSAKTTVSLTASDSRTTYDDTVAGASFDVRAAALGFSGGGARTTLTASAGYTQLLYLGETHGGLQARLDLTRLIGARSQFSLELGTQYSDATAEFAQQQNFQGVQAGPVVPSVPVSRGTAPIYSGAGPLIPGGSAFIPGGTSTTGAVPGVPGGIATTTISTDPFKLDYANTTWSILGPRTTLSLGLNVEKEVHQSQMDLNRTYGTLNVTVTRRLTPLLSISANGSYTRQRFSALDAQLNSWNLGAGVDWLLNRVLTLQATFNRQDGSGTGADSQYTEDRVYIGISYSDGRHAR